MNAGQQGPSGSSGQDGNDQTRKSKGNSPPIKKRKSNSSTGGQHRSLGSSGQHCNCQTRKLKRSRPANKRKKTNSLTGGQQRSSGSSGQDGKGQTRKSKGNRPAYKRRKANFSNVGSFTVRMVCDESAENSEQARAMQVVDSWQQELGNASGNLNEVAFDFTEKSSASSTQSLSRVISQQAPYQSRTTKRHISSTITSSPEEEQTSGDGDFNLNISPVIQGLQNQQSTPPNAKNSALKKPLTPEGLFGRLPISAPNHPANKYNKLLQLIENDNSLNQPLQNVNIPLPQVPENEHQPNQSRTQRRSSLSTIFSTSLLGGQLSGWSGYSSDINPTFQQRQNESRSNQPRTQGRRPSATITSRDQQEQRRRLENFPPNVNFLFPQLPENEYQPNPLRTTRSHISSTITSLSQQEQTSGDKNLNLNISPLTRYLQNHQRPPRADYRPSMLRALLTSEWLSPPLPETQRRVPPSTAFSMSQELINKRGTTNTIATLPQFLANIRDPNGPPTKTSTITSSSLQGRQIGDWRYDSTNANPTSQPRENGLRSNQPTRNE